MSGWRQLWFGCAVPGLEGHDRGQVVACTPGLLDDPAVEAQLLRLCRYDHHDSPAARRSGPAQSFGWIDEEELRFVFCRTPVESADGTSTACAAHVLVGPRADTTVTRVLGLFDSSSWWRGELLDPALLAAGRVLPETALEAFEPAAGGPLPTVTVPDDAIAGLAEAVLAGGGATVVLPDQPGQAVAVMRALAREVPALAEVVSFSSHELGPAQDRFDVVGRAGAAGRNDAVTIERALASRGGPRLGAKRLQDAQSMVSAVLPFVVSRHGELDRDRRDLFFRAVDAIIRRDDAGIARLVDDPRSMLLLVSSAAGRDAAAASLWGPVRPRWVHGNQSLGARTEQLRELGALTWRSRPDGATPEAVTDVWTRLGTLGRAAESGFVRAFMTEALSHDAVGLDPPGRLSASCLRTALEARMAPDVLTRLVDVAAAHVDADLLTSPIVPVAWRVRCAVTALRRGTLTRAALGSAAARDSRLAQQLLGDDIDDEVVDAILAAVPPEHAAVLVAAAIHGIGHARAMRSLHEVGRTLGSARILTVLDALTSVSALELDEEDQEWAAGHFTLAVAEGAHDSGRPDPVTDLPWGLATRLTAPRCDSWRRAALLVRPADDEGREVVQERFAVLLGQIDDERQRRAIASLGIDVSLLSAQTAEHVTEAVHLLSTGQGVEPGELISLVLTRAERLAAGPGSSRVGPLLVHLGSTWVDRPRLQRRPSLPDGHQSRAEALAARVSERQRREVLRAAGEYGSTCRSWLRGLAGTGWV